VIHLLRNSRNDHAVLDALAAVGESGMTDTALAVTTQLPEQRLHATLRRLTEAGLVEPRPDPGALTLLRRACYRLVPRRRV
jgi:DNA-binding IclR family transcriptional regulator